MNRKQRILAEAVTNLSEYYQGLTNPEEIARITSQVHVPDTGNDQHDYQNVRDQIETLIGKQS